MVRTWLDTGHAGYRREAAAAAVLPSGQAGVRLVQAARLEGLESFAHLACRDSQAVPGDILAAFRREYHATALANAVASDDLNHVLAEFEAHGVPVLVLKGAFLSHAVYRNLALRPMGDIDLLVKPQHVQAAHNILSARFGARTLGPVDISAAAKYSSFLNSFYYLPAVGAAKRWPARAGPGDRAAGDAAPHNQPAPVRGEPGGHAQASVRRIASAIHLHWHLVNASYPLDFYGRKVDMERVWHESRSYDAEGQRIPGLAPQHLLIHLCEHALKHSFSELRHLADIAAALVFMTRVTAAQADSCRSRLPSGTDALLAEAAAFGLQRAVYYGLSFASQVFELDVPRRLLNALRPLQRFRCELLFERLFARNVRKVGLNWLVYFAMMRSFPERLSFIFRTFWPSGGVRGLLLEPGTTWGIRPCRARPAARGGSAIGRLSRLVRGVRSGLAVLRQLLL
jgi:hypothetical protein